MRVSGFFSMVGLFVAATIFAVFAQDRTITVTGKVVDSVTGAGVPRALILLYDSETLDIDYDDLGSLKYDTAFTDTAGAISYTMTVTQKAIFLFYGVLKQGYQLYYSAAGILPTVTTVNLGTIKLTPAGLAGKDTLTVSGKVIDSMSGDGLAGAIVAISGLGGIDTAGNIAITTGDGTFSRQVIVDKTALGTIVGYIASKQGYIPRVGQKKASSKQLDLGNIPLRKSAGIIPGPTLSSSIRNADAMSLFSLNGKLLYEGPVTARLSKTLLHPANVAIVRYTKNKTPVAAKGTVLIK